ncbi:uncharacterized protein JCM15063_004181 [Sporobolomyces koalae]|uniref:uncharacterized protein n=1 Tax=Sporobolomyces koalae TaxID=500713 RepID=UPI00316E6153
MYSLGYPSVCLDDLPPPLANVYPTALTNPITQFAVAPIVGIPSITTPDITNTCERSTETAYTCKCLAQVLQRGKLADGRKCKHLRCLLGDEHENARCDENMQTLVYTPGTIPANPKQHVPKAYNGSSAAPAHQFQRSLLPSDLKGSLDKPRHFSTTASRRNQPNPDSETGRSLLLAHKFDLDGKLDPTGWWMSEKLDGVRAYWDGVSALWSRTGKPLLAPKTFLDQLPRGCSLDGELYLGKDRFDEISGIARSHDSPRWNEIKYMVFDAPSLESLPFEERLAHLKRLFPTLPPTEVKNNQLNTDSPIILVQHERCHGMEDLKNKLAQLQDQQGEGLMLRQPGSLYVGKRSRTLLKVKTFYDAEARVVGYEPGKGKYEGMTGSLICEMEDETTTFSVGSGLTDERRLSPPPIGSIVTYRFFELTKQKVPRFPTFVGERIDSTSPKDAVVRSRDLTFAMVESGSTQVKRRRKKVKET